ncbi:hypothetical protein AAY473_015626 [Plecturocebus cupreus]
MSIVRSSWLQNRSWILISFSNKKKQGSLEKWMILGLGWERRKMSLEKLVESATSPQRLLCLMSISIALAIYLTHK